MAKRCSSWWYASKRKRHKKICSSSKQTSGVRVRMRDRNISTRRDNVEGQTDRRGDIACGDCKEDAFLMYGEWSRATYYLNVYMLRTSPMDLHPFMPGINVARYALLSITAPPFRTGGASLFAPKTIKYRGDHSIWRVFGQPYIRKREKPGISFLIS